MNLSIIFPGKKLKPPESTLADEYIKRTSRYANLSLTYVNEPRAKLPLSSISDHLKKFPFLISLDVKGQHLSSEEFASFLDKHRTQKLCFLIGPSYGLSQEILDSSQAKLSLSKMTLPHRLALILLTEQIYRATSFLKGHPYHHSD